LLSARKSPTRPTRSRTTVSLGDFTTTLVPADFVVLDSRSVKVRRRPAGDFHQAVHVRLPSDKPARHLGKFTVSFQVQFQDGVAYEVLTSHDSRLAGDGAVVQQIC
jgi:hypothetical protein